VLYLRICENFEISTNINEIWYVGCRAVASVEESEGPQYLVGGYGVDGRAIASLEETQGPSISWELYTRYFKYKLDFN